MAPYPNVHDFLNNPEEIELNPVFARPGEATSMPRNRMPERESLPETAYQIVHDESMLDGNARLNLATFVGTWMDDYAKRIDPCHAP